MTDYAPAEIQQITKINEDQHIGLLTNCGIHQDFARKILAMSDADLTAAIAQFEPVQNKTAMQVGLVAAAKREIIIRQA
jgi:hypothetical protein